MAADEDDQPFLALLNANVAWCALKAGDPANAPLAETLAREAFAAVPEAAEMKGTLGAVFTNRGAIDEGIELLRDAARHIADPLDKADFCIFLARGEHARGNSARANTFAELRRHILVGA